MYARCWDEPFSLKLRNQNRRHKWAIPVASAACTTHECARRNDATAAHRVAPLAVLLLGVPDHAESNAGACGEVAAWALLAHTVVLDSRRARALSAVPAQQDGALARTWDLRQD